MPAQPVRIMVYRHSCFYSPLLASIAAGFLKEEGLDAVYFVKPKERNLYEMFQQGEVDIMQAAVSTSWDPLSKGIHDIPRHFAQINQRDGFFIVGRDGSPSFSWKELEGAELIADHSQQPLAMLKYALHRQGVDWSRIQSIQGGSPEAMERTFREGKGDYIHLQGPAAQQLEQDGRGRIVACVGDLMPPIAFSSLMAMPSFLETEPAMRFMRAFRRSLVWVNEAPATEVAALESPLFEEISQTALAAAIARYQQLGTWRRDPVIPRDQYEAAMDVFIFNGIFQQRFPYEDVVAPVSNIAG
jgi:NitT/TauT family transport system substrate-binding protein